MYPSRRHSKNPSSSSHLQKLAVETVTSPTGHRSLRRLGVVVHTFRTDEKLCSGFIDTVGRWSVLPRMFYGFSDLIGDRVSHPHGELTTARPWALERRGQAVV